MPHTVTAGDPLASHGHAAWAASPHDHCMGCKGCKCCSRPGLRSLVTLGCVPNCVQGHGSIDERYERRHSPQKHSTWQHPAGQPHTLASQRWTPTGLAVACPVAGRTHPRAGRWGGATTDTPQTLPGQASRGGAPPPPNTGRWPGHLTAHPWGLSTYGPTPLHAGQVLAPASPSATRAPLSTRWPHCQLDEGGLLRDGEMQGRLAHVRDLPLEGGDTLSAGLCRLGPAGWGAEATPVGFGTHLANGRKGR